MKCYFCETELPKLTIDHIVPVYLGGNNLPRNKLKACFKCNQLKGSLMPSEFLEKLETLIKESSSGYERSRLRTIRKNTRKLDKYVKEQIINLIK